MSGPLFLIGGHEEREGDRVILRAFAAECRGGPIALITAASSDPPQYVKVYREAFAPLTLSVVEVPLPDRATADEEDAVQLIADCTAVFISGGGQLRAIDKLSGTRAARLLRECWERGTPIAGTSAGASVLGEWMLGRGADDDSPEPGEMDVVHGLGLLEGVLVDQHLSQRGRLPRLMAATAAKGAIGIGVDENTAAVVRGRQLEVIGEGTVTIVRGAGSSMSRESGRFSLRDLQVDVLAPGETAMLVAE